ncbi:Exosome complex component RRP46 [Nakaseomyces bracarensis]|uniref:Exosome complex component RRP46 n=1 Tax=Nakaseomyces bracarensis TaxID=273131 RepID=A0ABR4NR41_9SACH
MVNAELSLLSQVDGSAKVSIDSTSVICSVTGPIEPKPRQELPTELALETIVRPAKGVPTPREKYLEDKIRAVFTPIITRHKYPRQLCQITVQVLEAGEDESLFNQKELTTSINATLLALVDAGVALNNMVAALTIAVINDGDKLNYITNPTDEDLKKCESLHAIALEIGNGSKVVKNVLLLESYGQFTEDVLFKVLEIGEQAALQICGQWRELIKLKIENQLQNQQN